MAQAHEETLTPKEHTSPGSGSARVLLRNIGYLAGSQATTWVATLLYTVIVTRAIGPRDNGELSSAVAFNGILATLIAFGSATYLVKEIAGAPSRAPRLVAGALAFQLLALPAAAAVTAPYLIAERFSREMTIVFLLFGLGLPATVCTQTLQAALQGVQRMGVVAASGTVTTLLYDLAAIVLVLVGRPDVILIALLSLVTVHLSLALTIAVYRRHFAGDWRIGPRDVRRVLRGGLPFLAAQVAYTLYVAADTLILTTFSSSTEVGWYSAANRLFASLLFVSTILSIAWLPRLAAHARQDRGALGAETRLLVRLSLLSSIPLAVGGFLVAGRLVTAVWGQAYAGASAPLAAILLCLPATSICTVLYQILVVRDRAATWAWVMAIALVLNVLINLALILSFRAEGRSTALAAAICLNLTEAGMAVVALWMNRRALGLPILWYAGRTLAAAVLMGAVVGMVARLPLALVVVIGGLVFSGLALAFRLVTREELGAARAAVQKVAHR